MCDASLFRKFFIIILSLEMLNFIDIISLALKCVIISWGVFILVHNYFIEKLAFKVKYKYILFCFLISMLITSIIHFSVWFVPNIVLILFTGICFFIFYGMYVSNSVESLESEMLFILKFFVYFAAVCGTISLALLLWKKEFTITQNYFGMTFNYNFGIFKNRFIGIYTNSNILGFSMIEAIVASDILSDSYLKDKYKEKIPNRTFLIFVQIISCLCLFLSDSNASFLFLIIYITIRVFCNMFFKNKWFYGFKFFKSVLITTGVCIVSMSVMFAFRNKSQVFIEKFMNEIYTKESNSEQNKTKNTESQTNHNGITIIVPDPETKSKNNQNTTSTELHIGREHYEVSSGRITLFKQGIKIFKHHPIMGISRANLNLYAKKYLPGGLIHPDLHNGYLTILVSYGIIGFMIFTVFSVLVAKDICKNMFYVINKNYFGIIMKLFSCLVSYCSYCLFEKAILFDMTFMVGFFWTILGYAIIYIRKTDEIHH